ncbi:hypothetical protein Q8F55_008395 [Vanrija albida]|uniref:AMP-dependent synthetase/ligase domain-containing protein n=1 Tax=Vanrija albida TaxID=181172 RepID=A0ABR3PW80_9TREE
MAIPYYSHYRTLPAPEVSIFQFLLPDSPSDSPVKTFDPELPAYIDGFTGYTLSRRQLKENALRLATGLRTLGFGRGDVACLWGMNSIPWVEAAYGLLAAGIRITPANYAYEPTEVAHQLNNSGAQLILLEPSTLERFEKARALLDKPIADEHVLLLAQPGALPAGTRYKSLYDHFGVSPGAPETFNGEQAHETAWQCYSSGTTGLPKGVETTQHNIVAQLQGLAEIYEPLESGKDVILGILPMSHIYGLAIVLLRPLTIGVPVVVLPKYEEHSVLSAVGKYHVTHAPVVPPIVLSLVNSPNVHKYDLSSLKTFLAGAAPMSAELSQAFEKRFPHIAVIQAYGMTETSPVQTAMSAARSKPGSCGQLVAGFTARLVGEDGRDVDLGEPGELWVQGPCVMKGYWKNPEATRKTFSDDGKWFKTGDIMVVDADGFYTVVDRSKELIKYKGFQVAPAELEALLLQHPKVHDAGVIGVWEESQATELPRAYVVASPDAGVSHEHVHEHHGFIEEIKAWVAARVANHKKLRGGIAVVELIPKSPSGKILRKDLRARAKTELEGGISKQAKL